MAAICGIYSFLEVVYGFDYGKSQQSARGTKSYMKMILSPSCIMLAGHRNRLLRLGVAVECISKVAKTVA
jgi:hypothetical protein